jgi:HK97 family phage major capsid protein
MAALPAHELDEILGRANRREITEAMDNLLTAAERVGRDLTADEQRQFDRCEEEARRAVSDGPIVGPAALFPAEPSGQRDGAGPTVRLGDGRTVRAVGPHGKFADVARNAGAALDTLDRPANALGSAIRSLVASDVDADAIAQRDQVLKSGPGGGFAVVPELSAEVIDLARAESVVVNAGGATMPLTDHQTNVVTIDSAPSGGWRGELEELPEGQVSFGRLLLVPDVLGVQLTLSEEFIQDSANGAEEVERAVTRSLGEELDRRFLRGELAGGDEGILDNSRVARINAGRTALTYDDVLDAKQRVADNKGTATSATFTPRDLNSLDKSKDSQNQYLQPPPSYTALTRQSTTQIPTDADYSGGGNNDESAAIVGNWATAQALIGVRAELTVQADRSTKFGKLGVVIRAWARMALAVGRPGHLCVIDELTA